MSKTKKMFLTLFFEKDSNFDEEIEKTVETLKENENIEKIEWSKGVLGKITKRNFYAERFHSIIMEKYNEQVVKDAIEYGRQQVRNRRNKDN